MRKVCEFCKVSKPKKGDAKCEKCKVIIAAMESENMNRDEVAYALDLAGDIFDELYAKGMEHYKQWNFEVCEVLYEKWSSMEDDDVPNHGDITPVEVLKSAAGYYLGRLMWDAEIGMWIPYSRVSGYYKTRQEAERDLIKYGRYIELGIVNLI